MAVGNYGTVRPADVSIDDVEIFYTKNDGNVITNLVELTPSQVLTKVDNPTPGREGEIFGGLYTLTLPKDRFDSKGIYTIVIRPKQFRTTIVDCGVLSANSDVKGIILEKSDLPSNLWSNNMVGYRIEYIKVDSDVNEEKKINNLFRIITSNNSAAKVTNANTTTTTSDSYSFNDSSSLMFCTLTPSSAPSVKPNMAPYIGVPGQTIIISNTFFNPIMLEVEMVEHDDETLAYALYGNQSKSVEDGIYTIYRFDNSIYRQYNLYEVKDQFTGIPLYEIREQRNNILSSKEFEIVKGA